MEQDQYPEELLGVKWETPPQQEDEFLSEDYLHQKSVTYKILNDNFTRVWSSDSDDDTEKKKHSHGGESQATQEPKPKINRRLLCLYKPFSAYPRTSNLTAERHQVYLKLMKKFSNYMSPYMNKQDQNEFQLYQTLKEKIGVEQIEYLEFLKNFAISNQSRYSSIIPDIKKYITELWKVQLKNPLKYPRYYRPYRTIGLVLNDSRELLDLIPYDEILKKGKVYLLNLNRKYLRIERDYSRILKRHPIIEQEAANQKMKTTFNCPVSQDENAEEIAKRMNVDVVLSSSGLKRICDNYPPFNKTWEIPVTVKEFDVEENGHSVKKRVIFIDKALPRRRMTVVDKLKLYHKIAIKRFLVNYHPLQPSRGGLNKKSYGENGEQIEDFLQLDWCDENDLETFGVDGSTCSKSTVEGPCSHVESAQISEDSVILNEVPGQICVPVENSDLSKQIDINETSSEWMSDSDGEQLVIDDPEVTSETKSEQKSKNYNAPFSNNPREKAPEISKVNIKNNFSVEESPKRQTRHMTKMLETLHKVEEIASIKKENNLATTNVQLGNPEAVGIDKISSPNEEVNDRHCEYRTSVDGKNIAKSRSLYLLDELLEQQKNWFGNERPKTDQCHSKPFNIKGKDFLKYYKPIPPPKDSNYIYRLFSLKKKDLSSPGRRLLIRCKTDARETPPKRRTATIVSKLEFQPEFGAEIVSASEMIQDWLSIRMRPASFLIRARINAFTSDVMMVEHKECKDFYKDEKYHNMQASSCLHTLEAVLRAFHDLPPAQYIFTHEPKMGAFGNIYMATNDTSGSLYDLHELYNVDTTADEPQVLSNLWMPIDFSVITPLYEALGRVPGTFIPKNQKNMMKKGKKKPNKRNKANSTSAI